MKKKIFPVLVASLAVLLTALLTGCGSTANDSSTALADKGYLTLSVNPEIRIEYNGEGLVTGLEGRNDDGDAIVKNYADYIGKDCGTVLQELVGDINEAGYFIEDADSGKRQIVLQIEPGSALPDDDFLELLSHSVQDAVTELSLGSSVVDIDSDDYDQRYSKEGRPSPYITLAKARQIALTHAGAAESDVRWDDREFDFDDGRPIYELEFSAKGVEYEYDIHAETGKILDWEADRDDDDDDRPAPSGSTSAGPSSGSSSSGSSSSGSSSRYIGMDKAKSIALKKAGVSASSVRWDDAEFDRDDGRPVYELEFSVKGTEYECEIHAETGRILDWEADRDDDWYDDDDDDDDDWDD